jgi:hypothetical protein
MICTRCVTCGLQNLQHASAAAPRLARWPVSVPRAASSGMQVGCWPERHIEDGKPSHCAMLDLVVQQVCWHGVVDSGK